MSHNDAGTIAGAKPLNGTRIYTRVWAGLMVLTIATVVAAGLDIGKLAIVVCLAIASLKSVLVLLYFMHLRQEKRTAIKLALPIATVTLAIFIGLTFIDVFTRQGG
jgi:cytochrome c oxidase subunit IV